jgi:UDP-GlcNAc:undecaprenyl-phosphate GlcNAc-1-phosphate transferase
MYSCIFLTLGAFCLCLALTPIVRLFCLRFGIVDHPDVLRKHHAKPIARLGGIAVCLSYVAAFVILLALPSEAGSVVRQHLPLVWKLLPAAAIVFVTGLLDDLCNLKPWQKLAGQLAASAIAFWGGVRILDIAGHKIDDWWTLPVTLFWLVGCTNAFNLIDGLDGLASGLGLFAALTMFLSAALQGNVALALALAPLAACLLAFLCYNFSPASIFLGDSGSLLIGFLLACYGVIWSQKSMTILGSAAPLMLLAVPLADTAIAVVRRFIRHRPIFDPDCGHIHHRLLARGFTPRRVAFVLYGVAAVSAAFSLLVNVVHERFSSFVVAFFVTGLLFGIHYLRFVEFDVARQMLFSGAFRRTLDSHFALRTFEEALSNARTVEQCWVVLRDGGRVFGFVHVGLQIDSQTFEERFRDADDKNCWHVRIPLEGVGCVEFEHDQHYASSSMIGPFIDVVCRQLCAPESVHTKTAVLRSWLVQG